MDIKRAKKEIKDSIEAYLAKDEYGDYMIPSIRQRPILLMGPPGIGKTQVMEQVAKECKVALVSYTITHHTRQSAVGLPFIEKKTYDGKEYSVTEYTMSEIIASVYEKIEDAEIWIPYGEVFKHYKSKRSDINKRVRKSLNEKEESQIEKVCFMNMCMIQDHKGNVLALDKVNDSYTGTTFPGGHVEANEIFQKSMIREVWEETGLTVEAPKLGGLYHWHKSGVHYVITLYKADKFTGELKSSEEGRVYWIPLEELKTKELATGMEHVLRILESEKVDECYMHLEADGYVGDLY